MTKSENKLWYYGELYNLYKKTPNKLLGERLLQILTWADDRSALVVGEEQGRRTYPQFRLMGKHDYEIFSFWSPEVNHIKPGTVHFFRTIKRFGGNYEYRRGLVNKINALLDYGYDLDNIDGSKTSKKALDELSEEEFSEFKYILDEYCL